MALRTITLETPMGGGSGEGGAKGGEGGYGGEVHVALVSASK